MHDSLSICDFIEIRKTEFETKPLKKKKKNSQANTRTFSLVKKNNWKMQSLFETIARNRDLNVVESVLLRAINAEVRKSKQKKKKNS